MFTWILGLPTKVKLILLGLILFLIALGYVGWLVHRANIAETEVKQAKEESERLQRQNEGLKILANTANIAIEVVNEKKIANQKSENSNLANRVYANTRQRDSNQSSNNFNEAKRRFCDEFPTDSLCQ